MSARNTMSRSSRRWVRGLVVLAVTLSPGVAEDRTNESSTPPSRETQAKDESGKDMATEPKPKKQSCFRSGCHIDLKEEAAVHGPLNTGLCDVCHIPDDTSDEEEHAWKLARSEQELCTFCHLLDSRRIVHDPVAKNNCLECHDPHQAANRNLLLAEPAELCAECHELPQHDFSHEPFLNGECVACHNGHTSDHPALISTEKRELCLGCHEEFQTTLATAEFVHTPVGEDCGSCHASHGAQEEALLKAAEPDLCLGCHEDILSSLGAAALQAAARKGVPVRDCLACHDPHVSSDSTLLAGGAREACLSCHDGKSAGGEEGASAGHGACTDCHSVHGSSGHGALAGSIPRSLYARFEVDAYSLCFECHSEEAFTAEVTTETRFRDGVRNLHRVHVVQPKRGRTCAICHDVHGSQLHALLRRSVPYGKGNWRLPIGFQILSDDRRQCEAGCHRSQSYLPGSSETEQSSFIGPLLPEDLEVYR